MHWLGPRPSIGYVATREGTRAPAHATTMKTLHRCLLPAFLAGCAGGVLAGCAEPPPPVVASAPIEEKQAIDDPSKLLYEAEVGGLPEEAMQHAFTAFHEPVEACLAQGYERVATLGGHFKMALKIDRSGRAKNVFLAESTLGDRDTEKCILDAARQRDWPHAVGGDGKADTSFDVDPPKEHMTWDPKKVKPAVEQARESTRKCRRGIDGGFTATAYVKPDGRVVSAGLATPNAEGEGVADCMVDVIRKLRFGRPGREAKVSFSL